MGTEGAQEDSSGPVDAAGGPVGRWHDAVVRVVLRVAVQGRWSDGGDGYNQSIFALVEFGRSKERLELSFLDFTSSIAGRFNPHIVKTSKIAL
jgi:hypothetical protein